MSPEMIAHESCRETPWDRWIAEAKANAGHSLDGDQATDGYSLDSAHEAFEAGKTPADYVASITASSEARKQALADKRATLDQKIEKFFAAKVDEERIEEEARKARELRATLATEIGAIVKDCGVQPGVYKVYGRYEEFHVMLNAMDRFGNVHVQKIEVGTF